MGFVMTAKQRSKESAAIGAFVLDKVISFITLWFFPLCDSGAVALERGTH